jgi:protein-L-isoaspartate(D-aspartate) O-methyltransferase
MDYAATRRRMVENQLRTSHVTHPGVIQAMLEVPREAFLPARLRGIAYVDEDIPLGNGRFLMEPLVLARLLQLAWIGPADAVLAIGCDCGYGAAVMARLATSVVALESDPDLVAGATRTLSDLGVDNVAVVEGPLAAGYGRGAPFDLIVFGGAVAAVPDAITGQLAEMGRVVAVVAGPGRIGRGTLMRRTQGVLSRRQEFDAATPVLPGFAPQPRFEFAV